MTESKRNALATALLIALIFVVFSDIVFFGRAFFYRDITRFAYASRAVIAAILHGGEFPFWNPYWQSGQPLAANPGYAIFYPGAWLSLLPGFDFWFRFHFVLHFCLAACGAFLLLRRWTRHIESAVFGAIVFSLSGLLLSLPSILPSLYGVSLTPWILWAIDRMSELFSVRRFAVAVLFIALMLISTEPVTVAQIGVLILVAAAMRGRSWMAVARALLAEVAGGVVAVVQLVPAADLLRDSARASGFPFELVSRWSTPPLRFAELFIPQLTGPAAEHFRLYWGTAKYGWLEPFFPGVYFGLIPIALAIAGLSLRLRGWRAVIALVIPSFLLALGSHTPLLKLLYDAHLFSSFRYPEKFLILGLIPLMLFSAIAFDAALTDRRVWNRAAIVAGAVVIACIALELLTFAPSYARAFIDFWDIDVHPLAGVMATASRAMWLRALIASAICATVLLLGRSGRRWAALAIAVTLFDLAVQRFSIAETIDGDFFRSPPPAAGMLNRSVRVFHQADWYGATVVARSYFDLPEEYWVVRNGLFPMFGATWGIATAMNIDIDRTFLGNAAEFNQAMLELRDRRIPRWFEPMMAMSAAGYRALYLPFEQQLARAARNPTSIQPVIFLPVKTNPVFYFADRVVRCTTHEEFVNAVVSNRFALTTAYADMQPFVPATARVVDASLRFNSAQIDVEAAGNALLVCSITRHKYWSATIDGRPANLLPVDIQYQALMIPGGRHTVRMRYRNPLIVACAAISLISFAVVLAAVTFPVRRK